MTCACIAPFDRARQRICSPQSGVTAEMHKKRKKKKIATNKTAVRPLYRRRRWGRRLPLRLSRDQGEGVSDREWIERRRSRERAGECGVRRSSGSRSCHAGKARVTCACAGNSCARIPPLTQDGYAHTRSCVESGGGDLMANQDQSKGSVACSDDEGEEDDRESCERESAAHKCQGVRQCE